MAHIKPIMITHAEARMMQRGSQLGRRLRLRLRLRSVALRLRGVATTRQLGE
jgi:hypothetical protein